MPNTKPTEIDPEQYYRRYGPMVLRRCRRLLGDEQKALDAMQEVFVRVIEQRNRLQHRFPSSLLFRISTNVCLNVLRTQRVQASETDEELLMQIAVYDEAEERLIRRDRLERIFRKEKPSTRTIAVMHFVDGMTLQEVSQEVGLSLSGVRKRLRALRERLAASKEINHES
jgi:RNA polymerase sigma-70 factor (ECF subfamily)